MTKKTAKEGNCFPWLVSFIVSSAKNKPPVLPGEMKSFSKNKTGEL